MADSYGFLSLGFGETNWTQASLSLRMLRLMARLSL